MDRFQTIESFVRVAHAGSFTKAARQLGLSRALISRRIIELEARLGVRLLNRSTRSVSLTAEGRAYLARCKQVLDDMEAAEREIARSAQTPLGGIRVLAPKSFGVTCLTDAIVAFSETQPQIRVSLSLGRPSPRPPPVTIATRPVSGLSLPGTVSGAIVASHFFVRTQKRCCPRATIIAAAPIRSTCR